MSCTGKSGSSLADFKGAVNRELDNPIANIVAAMGSERLACWAYCVAFCSYCLAGLLTEIDFPANMIPMAGVAENVLQLLAIGLLLFKLVVQRYTVGAISVLVGAGIVIGLSAVHAGSFTLAWMFLFVAAGQGEDVKTMLRASIPLFALVVLTVVLLSVINVFPNVVLPDARAIRCTFGFKHPNMLAKNLTFIAIGWIMMRFNSLGWRDVICSSVVVCLSYCSTKSRTFLGVGIFSIVFLVIAYRCQGRCRQLGCTAWFPAVLRVVTVVALVCFSIAAMMWFDPSLPICVWLNSLLSERLRLAHEFYLAFPPTLWGNHQDAMVLNGILVGASQTGFLVDNAYAHLVLSFGYVAAGSFIALYLFLLWNGGKSDGSVVVLGMLVCAVVGLGESCMLDCSFNPYFAIAAAEVLYARLSPSSGESGCLRQSEKDADIASSKVKKCVLDGVMGVV